MNMPDELNYQHYPILLVDDDPVILETLKVFLEDTFLMETTDNPEKALEMLQTKEYAVILSDQRMPEMNGSTLLAKARQLSPESIRVLITGYTDLKAAIESINKGEIYRYIPKQISSEDKEILIKQAVELYLIRKEKVRLQRENELMLKKLAVQQKLSAIGYFGFRLNEWLSSILGTLARSMAENQADKGLHEQLGRLKSLMQRIDEVYRQTNFDIPRLREQMEFEDLNEIVLLSIDFSRAFIRKGIRQDWQGIQISANLDETLPRFLMARGPIQIAIEELLINAKQAIEETRLDSTNYSAEGKINIKTQHKTCRGSGKILLEIADNGCGIPPENLKDIFKPLICLSKYPVDRPGIGLNIVEQVVAFHNGEIHVESAPDYGSKFTLEFPAG
jgi:signal transduction histidine kinase